ncbi:toxin-antitoxin system YwqK family antitoxin [Flavobacterium sp. NKUCC04_CG]|uniref:toxin-antitoxin system YwqK family antitoxin n=1 Tax=Flavobacterium sp. NKUCC04_CG TaxID=2842121 RepID=UPI001C5B0831|nr:toxin-antitoxin system YwqK family antitoxin [Flavobacterium sp. NKUCC04_CG]MBW3520442.1 toxin-antitoxin system YwqK family antitoxin [Flavobacterium sp. NKUCC04_CG]
MVLRGGGFLWILILLIVGCKKAAFDDATKRNADWAYWIDEKTGESSWIRVGDNTTVDDGIYFLFYHNGNVYYKGKIRNKNKVDTTFHYGLDEKLIKYIVFQPDTTLHVYLHDGPYTEYFQDETLYQKGTISNARFNDDWVRYYKNGQIEWLQDYKNETGTVIWYYENGQKSSIGYFINRKANGEIKHWYETGQIKESTYWNNGLQEGKSTFYFDNGQVESRQYWVAGKREGKTESWYENGKKAKVGYYENGKLHGSYIQWTEKGNVEIDGSYDNGILTAKIVTYHDNGKIAMEGKIKDDKPDEIWNSYHKTGKHIKTRFFHNNELVNEFNY